MLSFHERLREKERQRGQRGKNGGGLPFSSLSDREDAKQDSNAQTAKTAKKNTMSALHRAALASDADAMRSLLASGNNLNVMLQSLEPLNLLLPLATVSTNCFACPTGTGQ